MINSDIPTQAIDNVMQRRLFLLQCLNLYSDEDAAARLIMATSCSGCSRLESCPPAEQHALARQTQLWRRSRQLGAKANMTLVTWQHCLKTAKSMRLADDEQKQIHKGKGKKNFLINLNCTAIKLHCSSHTLAVAISCCPLLVARCMTPFHRQRKTLNAEQVWALHFYLVMRHKNKLKYF